MTDGQEKSFSNESDDKSGESSGISASGLQRRTVIQRIAVVIAGTALASIASSALFEVFSHKSSLGQAQSNLLTNGIGESSSTIAGNSTAISSSQGSSFVTIKVIYFGMANQTGGIKQEYITLSSPAYLQDAISMVTDMHPLLLPMIGAMQIVIDGNPAEPDQELMNRDELDFIPVQAGG